MATNLQFIKSESASSVSSLSVTDCFSANYDVYYCSLEFVRSGTNATQANKLTFLDGSGSAGTTDYGYATLQMNMSSSFGERRDNSNADITWISYDDKGASSMYIFNPYDSSSYTFLTSQATGDTYSWKTIANHNSAESVAGFKWTFNGTGQYDDIKVKVYGVK